MAKSQENGTTILLGLKDYKVGEVWGGEDRVVVKTAVKGKQKKCSYCGSTRLYGHSLCKPREVLHRWSNGKRVYLELHRHYWRCHDCSHTFTKGRELVRKNRNFSQVRTELGVGYGTLRRLMKREINEEALGFIQEEDEIYLGIDEHSFRHQEMVYVVTEVKKRRVLGILRDDRIATLKKFLSKIPRGKVKEVCIDMKDGLRKAVEGLFPLARAVVDPFHIIADSNKRMDEARRIEQDVYRKGKVRYRRRYSW